MAIFKRTVNLNGKFKDIATDGEHFYDEDGEIIDLSSLLYEVYGNRPFDISTSYKSDDEVTPNREG